MYSFVICLASLAFKYNSRRNFTVLLHCGDKSLFDFSDSKYTAATSFEINEGLIRNDLHIPPNHECSIICIIPSFMSLPRARSYLVPTTFIQYLLDSLTKSP